MKRTYLALIAFALAGAASPPARAVPPTATPSPGYEARLQEQRGVTSRHNAGRQVAPRQAGAEALRFCVANLPRRPCERRGPYRVIHRGSSVVDAMRDQSRRGLPL